MKERQGHPDRWRHPVAPTKPLLKRVHRRSAVTLAADGWNTSHNGFGEQRTDFCEVSPSIPAWQDPSNSWEPSLHEVPDSGRHVVCETR